MDGMRRKLVERDRQLRQMLGGVAHEIRNPLGGIEIYAGLIADDLPDGDDEAGRERFKDQVLAQYDVDEEALDTMLEEADEKAAELVRLIS